MAPFHQSNLLRTLALPRPASRTILSPKLPKPSNSRHYAAQSYGGGEGDPKGENPQAQGSSPATANAEHPGPPPPDTGKGNGGTATKQGNHEHGGSDAAAKKEGGSQHGATSGGSAAAAAAQPKIHKHDAPHPDNHSEEVKRHNEEVANRHEKPQETSRDESDQVGKGYWKGQGGADRDP